MSRFCFYERRRRDKAYTNTTTTTPPGEGEGEGEGGVSLDTLIEKHPARFCEIAGADPGRARRSDERQTKRREDL